VRALAQALDPGKAELVVGGALFVVAEHLVGFGRFLEILFCALVPRILVGMVFDGELPVGFFYFVLGRAAGDAQDFVIISFCHVLTLPFHTSRVEAGGYSFLSSSTTS
jgi:hypothetical protein